MYFFIAFCFLPGFFKAYRFISEIFLTIHCETAKRNKSFHEDSYSYENFVLDLFAKNSDHLLKHIYTILEDFASQDVSNCQESYLINLIFQLSLNSLVVNNKAFLKLSLGFLDHKHSKARDRDLRLLIILLILKSGESLIKADEKVRVFGNLIDELQTRDCRISFVENQGILIICRFLIPDTELFSPDLCSLAVSVILTLSQDPGNQSILNIMVDLIVN